MVEQVTIVYPEAYSEEPECGCEITLLTRRGSGTKGKHTQAQMLISGGKKGGNPSGNIGGEEEKVTAEGMLQCKIAQ